MMLPSGNDAAYAIAEIMGRIIVKSKRNELSSNSLLVPKKRVSSTLGVKAFLLEMNKAAEELQLM
jgi:D-alanyl-D-alanine carboxypeptidase